MKRRVVVVGSGVAAAAPDRAVVRFAISAEAADVSAALGQVGELVRTVGTSLREVGVPDGEIRSSSLAVHPRYDREGQQASGFQAQHQLTVGVTDLARVGLVISAAVAAGDDHVTIDSVSLALADRAALESLAREAAFADARRKAVELAALAQADLTTVVAVAEVAGGGGGSPRAFKLAADVGIPIEAGEESVQVSLEVTFALA